MIAATSAFETTRIPHSEISWLRRKASVPTSAPCRCCPAPARAAAGVSLSAAAPLSIARSLGAENHGRAAPFEFPGSDAPGDSHARSATNDQWPADAGHISILPVALECRPQPFRQQWHRFAALIVVEAPQPRLNAQVRRPEANSLSRWRGNRAGADSSS